MRFHNSINPYCLIRTVTTAGTPVQVSTTSVPVPDGEAVCLRAHPDNTGWIYIADTSDNALSSSSAHTLLAADQAEDFQVLDLDKIYVNSSVSGEKVIVTFARH